GTAPAPVTFSGSYSPSAGVSFSGHDALFGDVTFAITPAGGISGGATNVPSANVSSMTLTGTATATTITVHYHLVLKPSGTAAGPLTLTKPGSGRPSARAAAGRSRPRMGRSRAARAAGRFRSWTGSPIS